MFHSRKKTHKLFEDFSYIEERLQPKVNVELTDLSEFFGTMATAKRNLKPKTIKDVVTPAKPEQTKMHLELESFFNRLSNFENALEEQITKPLCRQCRPSTRESHKLINIEE